MKQRLKEYLWNMLIAIDQLLNTALAGHPDETFSARAYRKAEAGQWFWKALRLVINLVFFWEEEHCRRAAESEAARKHSPKEFANG